MVALRWNKTNIAVIYTVIVFGHVYHFESWLSQSFKPSSPSSSSLTSPTFTQVERNPTSPPSHSSNLNAPPAAPLHSRPLISVPSPSAPRLSTPTPPDCETFLFSSSRSRIVRTRVIATSLAELEEAPTFRRSVLCARMSKLGVDSVGGSDVIACNT